MLLILLLPYVVILAVHAGVHWRLAKRLRGGERPRGIVVSHALLLAGFLLQFDGGDAPLAGEAQYYPMTILLGLGTWNTASVIALNHFLIAVGGRFAMAVVWLGARDPWTGWSIYELALFVPVAISWAVLLRRTRGHAGASAKPEMMH